MPSTRPSTSMRYPCRHASEVTRASDSTSRRISGARSPAHLSQITRRDCASSVAAIEVGPVGLELGRQANRRVVFDQERWISGASDVDPIGWYVADQCECCHSVATPSTPGAGSVG